MKRVFLALAVLLASLSASAQSGVDELWDRANSAYVNGDYAGAISRYDSILEQGYVSDRLYYNLGNAHFRDNHIGKSILYYNRALDLAPTDSEIRHNLRVANGYVKDKIEVVPEFFFKTWVRSLRVSLSSNTWALVSIVVFVLALAAALLYLLSTKLSQRKAGFWTAVVMLLLFVVTITFSAMERHDILYSDEAVVMTGAVSVKSSPGNNSKELFLIHEGTKVKVLREMNGWKEIQIANGSKGWIIEGAVEII